MTQNKNDPGSTEGLRLQDTITTGHSFTITHSHSDDSLCEQIKHIQIDSNPGKYLSLHTQPAIHVM